MRALFLMLPVSTFLEATPAWTQDPHPQNKK